VLVGAFVLLGGGMFIAVTLWLASGAVWRTPYNLYLTVMTESVAGLNTGAPVKLNGVDVGQVRTIRLDPANPERVRVLLAIEIGTPVKVDTVAVLKTQGLTGIAYVDLSGGTTEAALLQASARGELPEIRSKPSLAARLENVLTNVLATLDRTSNNIDAVLSTENRIAITSVLADLATVTRTVAARKGSIDAGLADAARTFERGARVAAQAGPALDRIDRAAVAVEKAGNEAATASAGAGQAVVQVGADLQRFTAETLPELQRLVGELNVLAGSLRRASEQVERSPNSLIFGRSPAPAGPGEAATAAGTR